MEKIFDIAKDSEQKWGVIAHGDVDLGVFEDRYPAQPLTNFYAAMHYLCVGLIEKFPSKLIVFNTPIKREELDTENSTTGYKLKQFVQAMREVCEYYAIPICDLFKDCCMNPSINEHYHLYFGSTLPNGGRDKTHPNEVGEKLMGDTVTARLLCLK